MSPETSSFSGQSQGLSTWPLSWVAAFSKDGSASKGPGWKLPVYLKIRPVPGMDHVLPYILGQHTYGPARRQRGERDHALSGTTLHEFVVILLCPLPHRPLQRKMTSRQLSQNTILYFLGFFFFFFWLKQNSTFLESKVDQEPGILSGCFHPCRLNDLLIV